MRVEVRRTFHGMRAEGVLTGLEYADAIDALLDLERSALVLPITEEVLQRASGPFAAPIRTLDAIHLASAMILRERRHPDLVFATHDRRLASAARAEGFSVAGVD